MEAKSFICQQTSKICRGNNPSWQKGLVFETKWFPWGGGLTPRCSWALQKNFIIHYRRLSPDLENVLSSVNALANYQEHAIVSVSFWLVILVKPYASIHQPLQLGLEPSPGRPIFCMRLDQFITLEPKFTISLRLNL